MKYRDKFPLTYRILKSAYYDSMPDQVQKAEYWFLGDKLVPAIKEQRENNLQAAVREVTEPVWSLCEDLLLGNYETNLVEKNKENFSIAVGNTDFNVCKVYHMSVSTIVTPDITENDTEHNLIVGCLNKVIIYELKEVPRKDLLAYYNTREDK